MADSEYYFVTFHKLCWQKSANYTIIFLTLKRLLKAQLFAKKANFSEKKIVAFFLLVLWNWKLSRNDLYRSRRSIGSFCASYKFVSIGTRRSLETNISKKRLFRFDKSILAYHFSNDGCGKHQGTIRKGSKSVLARTGSFIIIAVTSKRLWKTQTFEKKHTF